MRIYVTHDGSEQFERLGRAMARSVRDNCPDVELICEVSRYNYNRHAPKRWRREIYLHNTHKLALWAKAAEQFNDAPLVLMDADTLVLGELQSAFAEVGSHDVGLTRRPGPKPYNAGVVFLRPTPQAVGFMRDWQTANDRLLENKIQLRAWVSQWGGINQAALMKLMDSPGGSTGWRHFDLDCKRWNNVDQTWDMFDADTRVVHYKGHLRDVVLAGGGGRPIMEVWHEYDRMEVTA